MLAKLRPRSVYDVVATLALFIALGGTAWAVAANSVGTAQLKNHAVTRPKLGANAVNGSKIANGSVGGPDLANNAVDGPKVADGSIAAPDIANNAVDGPKIADGSIAAPDIADSAVNGAKIADGSVAGADLAANAVNGAKIADSSIAAPDIGINAVDGAKIADDSLTGDDVIESSLSGVIHGKMLDQNVPSDNIRRAIATVGPYSISGECVTSGTGSVEYHIYALGQPGFWEAIYSFVNADDYTTALTDSDGGVIAANAYSKVLGFGAGSTYKRAGGTFTLRSNAGTIVQVPFSLVISQDSHACHIWATAMTG